MNLKKPLQEVDVSKPAHCYRIIILGDSTTYLPYYVNRPIRQELSSFYPFMLERKLNALKEGLDFEVVNAAVPGYNLIQEVECFKQKWVNYAPDLVIVGYCPNDFSNEIILKKNKDGIYQTCGVEKSAPYLVDFPANKLLLKWSLAYRLFNRQISQFLPRGKALQFNILTDKATSSVKSLKYLSASRNFELLFLVFPGVNNISYYEANNSIRNACRENKIEFIDIYSSFLKKGMHNIRLADDDEYHFNYFGNEVVADEVFKFLIKNRPWGKKLSR